MGSSVRPDTITDDAARTAETKEPRERLPMNDQEVRTIVGQMINDARTFVESELSPIRGNATDYYLGRPFGDEEKGRSQVVSTDVRDAVQGQLPDLLRIFFGPERIVEFRAREMEDVQLAEQQTDYINFIIEEDNNGFLVLHSAFKDALIRKQGVVKFWWEDSERTESVRLTGVNEDQLTLFASDPSVEVLVVSQNDLDPNLPPTFTVEVTRTSDDGRVKLAAVPTEEWLFSRDSRDMEDALMVAHRRKVRRSDLVALGVPEAVIDEHGGISDLKSFNTADEALKRQPNQSVTPIESFDDASHLMEYTEAYPYLDVDGDGVAELRRITTLGNSYFVLTNEPWDHRPFALFIPDPEPHTMIGLCTADDTMDIQNIKSHVLRGMLDSLSFSLHPRTAAVEGQVNLQDVINTEIGAVIRERQPNMVREFVHTFVGGQAFPVLDYMDEQKENRTGVSKAAAGLNPDALQSSTKGAVQATVAGAQKRTELLARIFAETGMKQLMSGILKLVVANQDRARVVRLRNEYVEIDPRPWTANFDVTINVAVGVTLTEERIAQLGLLAQKQEQILQMLGPNNPLVTLGQYRETLAKIAELSGFKDTTQFFQPIPLDFQPPPPQGPDPAQQAQIELAQAQSAALQAQAAKDAADAQTKQAEVLQKQEEIRIKELEVRLREDRERDRIEADAFLRAKEIEMKFQTKVDELELKRRLQERRPEQGAV